MIRNILCVNKIFLWLTWALVFIPTDAKSFQSISGTSGVATQRKIIHLGQFLKSKPNFAPRVNDVEAVPERRGARKVHGRGGVVTPKESELARSPETAGSSRMGSSAEQGHKDNSEFAHGL